MGECNCSCHSAMGVEVKHVAPCCGTFTDYEPSTRRWGSLFGDNMDMYDE